MASGDASESLAGDSAAAFLHRVRQTPDPDMAERIIAYADEHGVDDVAELWAEAPAVSLPGALWRIHLLRHVVASDPRRAGLQFREGVALASDADAAVAGAPHTPSPEEIRELANTILSGAFTGDFAVALARAAAFCRIQAEGAQELGGEDEQRAARAYAAFAAELTQAAAQWRAGSLT